jgi:DNA-binding NarL/FixJ family response regulator
MTKFKIAILEDNKVYSNLVSEILDNEIDAHIRRHDRGETLLETIESGYDPDIIIADYDLSGPFNGRTFMTGLETIQHIKKIKSNTNFIMLSAHNDGVVSKLSMELGAFDYVVKDDQAHSNILNRVKNLKKAIELNKEVKENKKMVIKLIIIAVVTITFSIFINY